jgi:hypothetical protein
MILIVIALIICAYVVGWNWHEQLNAEIVKAVKWVGQQIVKLWKAIWKKK